MEEIIHIYGASGSGTSTLGKSNFKDKGAQKQKFGDRIESGGDIHQQHTNFLEGARMYDTGDLNMRSKMKHDEWQKLLKCKQIILNGADEIDLNFIFWVLIKRQSSLQVR